MREDVQIFVKKVILVDSIFMNQNLKNIYKFVMIIKIQSIDKTEK